MTAIEYPNVPPTGSAKVVFPRPRIMVVTITREKHRNALPLVASYELDTLFNWFEREPTLLVAIITGSGNKAFSAGMDLKETLERSSKAGQTYRHTLPASGFAGLSMRTGRKPIIAAVNGFAHGGGFEICLNSDLVIASEGADFALPEVKRGVAAMAGGFARVLHTFGLHRGMDLVLTGRSLPAQEAKEWGLVRAILPPNRLMDEAIALAELIASYSPDSVIISRAGVRQAWETASMTQATALINERYRTALLEGENVKIGLSAFKEKQKPKWKPSNL